MPANTESANNTPPQPIDINAITIGDRRPVDPQNVENLVASISGLGHYSPIMVDSNFKLIAGRHRLEALKELRHQTVLAYVLDVDEDEAKILQLDENLCRYELNTAEWIAAVTERKEAYERLHPSTKHGGDRSGRKDSSGKVCHLPSYADDTAAKTGASARKIRQHATIGKRISSDRLRRLGQTPISEKLVELQKFSTLQEPNQETVLEALEDGEATSVRQAILLQNDAWSDEMLAVVFDECVLEAVAEFTVVDLRLLAAKSKVDQHEALALVAKGLSVAEAIEQVETQLEVDEADGVAGMADSSDDQLSQPQLAELPDSTSMTEEVAEPEAAIEAFRRLVGTDVALIRGHIDPVLRNSASSTNLEKLRSLADLVQDAIDLHEALLALDLQAA